MTRRPIGRDRTGGTRCQHLRVDRSENRWTEQVDQACPFENGVSGVRDSFHVRHPFAGPMLWTDRSLSLDCSERQSVRGITAALWTIEEADTCMLNLAIPIWELVLRSAVVYAFLLALLRLTGKRQIGQSARSISSCYSCSQTPCRIQ
jgi:hypothetical protein